MCVILDTNRVGDVFSKTADPVARQVFDWMNSRRCRLVVGGELRRELEKHSGYPQWSRTAALDGRLRLENDRAVDELTTQLVTGERCVSDDPHVIALAQLSGARVLYSTDGDLRDDFRNTALLRPRGSLLPLHESENARKNRHRILTALDLCPTRMD